MDMYISCGRLRLGKHRKTAVELLELGTLLRVVMREIDHVHRAGLGSCEAPPIRAEFWPAGAGRIFGYRELLLRTATWFVFSCAP